MNYGVNLRKIFNVKCNRNVRICRFNELNRFLRTTSITYTEVGADSKPPSEIKTPKRLLLNGPNLKDFFKNEHLKNVEGIPEAELTPYLQTPNGGKQKVFFDVHGCQMNVNDTEIIWAILKTYGFIKTDNVENADIVLLITCAIRESAETKIWNRLNDLHGLRNKKLKHGLGYVKIALLGCMAERLKHKILEREKTVDIIAGPDSYKDLPRLLTVCEDKQTAINVMLSQDETYADIMPVRLNPDSVTAFISIMRGCDNMCTYCIVPFTRGRERSRPIHSIQQEIKQLSQQGVKEVTLLGQNVNSYRDLSTLNYPINSTNLSKGFKTVYKNKVGGIRFADLLQQVAEIDPEMRIRFTSPHPKDFPDEVLQVIRDKPNICKNLHLPAQSGNSNVLERMRRGYTRESYLELVANVRKHLPDVHLSSDFICGFCGETEEEFADTLSLIESVRYNNAYLFAYSMREKTTAHRRYQDDVNEETKKRRMQEMIRVYRTQVEIVNRSQIGQVQLVLVEGFSKRSVNFLQGRNDGNTKVIIPAGEISTKNGGMNKTIKAGDYVAVQINDANSQVLKGIPLYHTTLGEYFLQDSYTYEYINYNTML